MSVVSLASTSNSEFGKRDLTALAAQLNIEIADDRQAQDYVRLLWSFEGLMKEVQDGSDFIPSELKPVAVSSTRDFRRPSPHRNPFNAWSHQCRLEAANATNDSLKGRTVAIKDNISVGGLPTTLGAPPSLLVPHGSQLPLSPIDATVVSRLLAAGAVIKGTATCECFCASPLSFTSATGPVHNPRLRGYTAGGSSSGCAALVALQSMTAHAREIPCDAVELAVGSDQAGSVRIPACLNGIYGLKPTFGLIPYTGAASMSPTIDHLGPLASRLEDIAIMLEVMAGFDGFDSRMTPESPLRSQVSHYSEILAAFQRLIADDPAPGKAWTVGLLKESFKIPGISSVVRDTVEKAAIKFFTGTGASVVSISIPMHLEGPIIWTAATRPSMSSSLCQGRPPGHLSYQPAHLQPQWPLNKDIFRDVTNTNPALGNIILSEAFAQKHLPAGLQAKAHRKVFELRAMYDKALEDVDVLITPCAPTVAMPHPASVDDQGQPRSILERMEPAIGITNNTSPFNVTGHPAISVPCGFSSPPEHPEIKLPIGLQIVGRRWADSQVLQAAALFERGRELTIH